jgi:hypothetical protein
LDVSQNSLSDASSAPTASSNPELTETTALSVPPHAPGILAHNGSDGSPSDLDSATTGTVADASSEHAPVSATLYQDPATDNDNAFYALSSDAYWSNDESVSHRFAELGTDGHGGELVQPPLGRMQHLQLVLTRRTSRSMTVLARSSRTLRPMRGRRPGRQLAARQ